MKRSDGKSKTDFSPTVREAIRRRSGGRCEVHSQHCTGRATHMHHRLRRTHPESNTVENGLHVCSPCHTYLHAVGKLAYDNGWLLRSGGAHDAG